MVEELMMVITGNKEEMSSTRGSECCMCGDYGLSDELFQCDVCSFRSQHRYCSNLYPKAESYRVCNWCLIRTDQPAMDYSTDPKSTAQNSSTSSLPSQMNDAEQEEDVKSSSKKQSRIKRTDGNKDLVVQISGMNLKRPTKSTDPSPPSVSRKRIITRAALEERLRRTKPEEDTNNSNSRSRTHSKGIITKHVYRNKVRRYKLLDEVSC
ncbi:hypothetical protein SAY86_020693 [Trapa natans]|uniref:PHD-type zinc finger plants domain-containing protein n=1 Tax=Trapa natans TaxID=22666 RepID=A0AAN7LQW6_TRANT|nr:hypothetical protein SAY86_020693 [Trapa natans]